MRRHYRWVALAAAALAAGAAFAAPASTNPLSRGEGVSAFGPGLHDAFSGGPLDSNALARPQAVHVDVPAPVTPVPEPHEWMMLIAGVGMGFMLLRRGAWRR
jgi:hypothetical protein